MWELLKCVTDKNTMCYNATTEILTVQCWTALRGVTEWANLLEWIFFIGWLFEFFLNRRFWGFFFSVDLDNSI